LRDRADFSVCMCVCGGGGDDFLRATDPFPEPALVPLPLPQLPRGPWGFRSSNVGGAAATARATGGADAGPENDVDAAIVAVERTEWECECECECEWGWDCEWWWCEKSGPGRLLRDAGGG